MDRLYREPIQDDIVDESLRLYPNHTIFTHLGCVLLRIFIGMFLIESTNKKYNNVIAVILMMGIIMFGTKAIKLARENKKILWKFYPRLVLIYSMALYYIKKDRTEIAGFLVILDALMGFQSRHIASAASFAIDQAKKKSMQ